MEKLSIYLKEEVIKNRNFFLLRLLKIYFFGSGSPRAILLYRIGKCFYEQGYGRTSSYFFSRLEKEFGVYISRKCSIGIGLQLPHPVGIVIGEGVKIGRNSVIYQHATLGGARRGDWQAGRYPSLGDNVVLFAGVVIVGAVNVGDHCVVGANSVVIKNIPSNSTAVGVPARIIKGK